MENQPTSDHVPTPSESFGRVPNGSEDFGNVPHTSEAFRSIPRTSERTEDHTLTVRQVARMFEAAGVARTERSVVAWCQPNKMGMPRLDCYLDPNERKYYITPQSVERAIAEEKAKMIKTSAASEEFGSMPKDSEPQSRAARPSAPEENSGKVKELEKEIVDLKITNRGKDYFIEQLQKEREGFAQERKEYVAQLIGSNRKLGELESRLLQLQGPNSRAARETESVTETPLGGHGSGEISQRVDQPLE